MDVPLAVLADAANVSSDGNLNILGIFDTIFAPTYPTLYPAVTLVIQLRPRRSESGHQARVVIRLMDADHTLAEIQGEFVVPEPEEGGRMVGLNQLFRIAPLGVPQAGDYAFYVVVNDEEKAVVPFHAVIRAADAP